MRKMIGWIVMAGVAVSFVLAAPAAAAAGRQLNGLNEFRQAEMAAQPLSIKLSRPQVHVGESVWLTVSGGVPPYVLIAADSKARSVSRGKNTYQISGLAAGDSRLTVKDSENNAISISIIVLPKR